MKRQDFFELKTISKKILTLALIFTILIATYPPKVSATGWVADYSNRTGFTVTAVGSNLTNHPMNFFLNTGSGIDNSTTKTFYLNHTSQYDSGGLPYDVRFTKSDGTTLLDYFADYDFASSVTEWNSSMADYPVVAGDPTSCVIGGKIYTFGGYNATYKAQNYTYAYDPATNSYTQYDDMPTARWGPIAVAVNNKAYVFGGAVSVPSPDACDKLEIFDPSQPAGSQWSNGTDVPYSAQGQCAVLHSDGLIHIMGGNTGGGIVKVHYTYNVTSDSYASLASLPQNRCWGTLATYGDNLYYISGWYSINARISNWVYYSSTDTWSTSLAPPPAARWGATRENPIVGDRIYVTHGQQPEDTYFNTTMIYDIGDDTWVYGESGSHNRDGVACGVIGSTIYVIAGRDNSGAMDDCESLYCGSIFSYYVELDSVSTLGTDFYFYHGNPAATDVSNGTNTFPFFDDFHRADGAAENDWTTDAYSGGSAVIVSNQLKISQYQNRYAHLQRTPLNSTDQVAVAKIKVGRYGGTSWGIKLGYYWDVDNWASLTTIQGGGSSGDMFAEVNIASTVTNNVTGAVLDYNKWGLYRIRLNTSNAYFEYSLIDTVTTWSNLRTQESRPAGWNGTPALLMLGKGYSDMPSYANNDWDNNYAVAGDVGYNYVGYVFVIDTAISDPPYTIGSSGSGYTITPIAGPNGTINPDVVTGVDPGSYQDFVFTPNAGYYVLNVSIDGGAGLGELAHYNFTNVQANHIINVTFNRYIVYIQSLATNDTTPHYGQAVLLTATAVLNKDNHTIGAGDSLVIEGVTFSWSVGNSRWEAVVTKNSPQSITYDTLTSVEDVSSGCTYGDMDGHSVTVTWVSIITPYYSGDGTINPDTAQEVIPNGYENFVFTPDADNYISDVKVDGVSVGTPNHYNFTNVMLDHNITVVFLRIAGYVTITSNPVGIDLSVDGANITTPYTVKWTNGTVHTISAYSPLIFVAGESKIYFNSWSDSGSQTHNITGTFLNATYTALYDWEYYLSVHYGEGTGSGWYASGVTANSTAVNMYNVTASQSRYNLYQYRVDAVPTALSRYDSGTQTVGVTMSSHHDLYWDYKHQYYVTNSSIIVELTTSNTGSQLDDLWYDSGTSATITAPPQTFFGIALVHDKWVWSLGGVPQANSTNNPYIFTVTNYADFVAYWKATGAIVNGTSTTTCSTFISTSETSTTTCTTLGGTSTTTCDTMSIVSDTSTTSCSTSTTIISTSTSTCTTSVDTVKTTTTTCTTSYSTYETSTTTCTTSQTSTTTCSTDISTYITSITNSSTLFSTLQTSTTTCTTSLYIDETTTTTCTTSNSTFLTSTTTCSTFVTCTSTCTTSTYIGSTCTTTSTTSVSSYETSTTTCSTSLSTYKTSTTTCSTFETLTTTCTSTCSTNMTTTTTCTSTCSTYETSTTTCTTSKTTTETCSTKTTEITTTTNTCSTQITSIETCTSTCSTSTSINITCTTMCTTCQSTTTSLITVCSTKSGVISTTTTSTTKTTGILVANQGWSILIVPILIFSGLILLIVMRRKR